MITHVKPLVAHIVRIPTDESLPLQYWAIDGLPRVNRKRKRKFFRTKDAAERELATVKKKLRKEGEKALLISDALRIEALDCQDRLKPYWLMNKSRALQFAHVGNVAPGDSPDL